jgi:hypothetical protein
MQAGGHLVDVFAKAQYDAFRLSRNGIKGHVDTRQEQYPDNY